MTGAEMVKAKRNNSKKQPFLYWPYYLVIAVITIGVYGNTFNHSYNLDDNLVTVDHRLTTKGFEVIPEIFTSPYYQDEMGYSYGYRPIVLLSFAVEHEIFGVSPTVSHTINILLYAFLCSLLFYVLINALPINTFMAILATIIFMINPLHTEVVASIKNRDEILALTFGLVAFHQAIKFSSSSFKPFNLLLFILLLILGVLSKNSIFSFLVLIPIGVSAFGSYRFAEYLILLLPVMIIGGLVIPVSFAHQKVQYAIILLAINTLIYFLLNSFSITVRLLNQNFGIIAFKIRSIIVAALELTQKIKVRLPSYSRQISRANEQLFSFLPITKCRFNLQYLLLFFTFLTINILVSLKSGYYQLIYLNFFTFLLGPFVLGVYERRAFYLYHIPLFIVLLYSDDLLPDGKVLGIYCLFLCLLDNDKVNRVIILIVFFLLLSTVSYLKLMEGNVIPAAYLIALAVLITYIFHKTFKLPMLLSILFFSIHSLILLLTDWNEYHLGVFIAQIAFFAFVLLNLFKKGRYHWRLNLVIVLVTFFTLLFGLSGISQDNLTKLIFKSRYATSNPFVERGYVQGIANQEDASDEFSFNNIEINTFQQKTDRPIRFVENPLYDDKTIKEKLPTAIYTVGFYLKQLAFPYPMRFYYGYKVFNEKKWSDWEVILSGLVIMGLVVLALVYLKSHPVFSFSIFWVLSSLAVFSNAVALVPGGVADRLPFVASLGFAMMIAYIVYQLLRKKIDLESLDFNHLSSFRKLPRTFNVGFLIFILVCSVYTVSRAMKWKDPLTLMRHDIKHLEESAQANNLLALNLMQEFERTKGETKRIKLLNEAINHFEQAVAVYPEFFNVHFDLGRAYTIKGNYKEAIQHYKRAIAIDSTYSQAFINLADLYVAQEKFQEAIVQYKRVLQIRASSPQVHISLSNLYFAQADLQNALEYGQKALKLDPDSYEAILNMGKIYYTMGDYVLALDYLNEAYKINPNNFNLLNALAKIHESRGEYEKSSFYRARAQSMRQ